MSYRSEVARLDLTGFKNLSGLKPAAAPSAVGDFLKLNFCHWLGNWLVLAMLSLLGAVLPLLATAADAPVGSALGQTFDAEAYRTCGLRLDSSIVCWGVYSNLYQYPVPAGIYTAVSAGGSYTCGLTSSGELMCWGDDTFGQTNVPAGIYKAVSTGSNYTGLGHTCGLLSGGVLRCWGDSRYGQTYVPAGTYMAVSAGNNHTCGILSGGVLNCWGYNGYGQTTVPAGTYTAVSAGGDHTCGILSGGVLKCWGSGSGQTTVPAGTYTAVSAGSQHTCGLLSNGMLKCWGYNGSGETTVPAGTYMAVSAGYSHTCGLLSSGVLTCWGDNGSGQTNVPAGLIRMLVQVGLSHSCVLKLDGTIGCWGDDSYGQTTPPTGTFRWLTSGSHHNCGVKTNKTVFCWGDDSYGQATPPTGSFSFVSAGESHTCGIKTDGTLACWGDTAFGQTTAPTGSTFDRVDAGDNHTCGIKTDGTLACWGNNTANQATPPSGNFTQVSAGTDHSCGIKNNDTVVCWGDNTYAQATPPSGSFVQVSAGNWHTCGLKTNFTVVCWGQNYDGQATAPAGNFDQISVNQYHGCGLKTDGSVLCWGDNSYNQLIPLLSVTQIGTGTGTVTSNPAGINCGTVCTAPYPPLSNVTLTATPASGSVFGGWSACTNLIGTCNVAMTSDKNVNAIFNMQSISTAPVITSATVANQRIILNWNAVTGASSYNLYQGTSANGELATPIKTGLTGTSYTVTSLTNGKRYYFKLQAVNASGVSALSNEVNALVAPRLTVTKTGTGSGTIVSTPAGIDCGATCSATFTANSNAVLTATPASEKIFDGWSTPCTSTLLVPSTTCSVAMSGDKSVSAVFRTPSIATAPVITSAVGANLRVILNWNAVTGASSYNIYQSTTSNGQTTTPIKTGATGTTFTVSNLTNGSTYYFKLLAVNASGTSALSNEISAVPIPPPPAPIIRAVVGNAQITLNWAAVAGAAKYNVYRGTTANGESTTAVLSNVTGTSVNVTGLTNGTRYFFKMKSVSSSNDLSVLSNEVNAIPLPPRPVAPVIASATAGNTQVTLTWGAVANAATYNVYQGTAAGAEAATPVKTGVTGTSFAVTGLTNGTAYYFKMAAVNLAGIGPKSNEVSATPKP